jgi:hypothetical protein
MARWSLSVFVTWGVFAVLVSVLMSFAAAAPRWQIPVIGAVAAASVSALGYYVYSQLGS